MHEKVKIRVYNDDRNDSVEAVRFMFLEPVTFGPGDYMCFHEEDMPDDRERVQKDELGRDYADGTVRVTRAHGA